MNTDARPAVRALGRRSPCLAVAALLASLVPLGAAGCVEIDGGAAELSWTLRTFAGEPVCDDDDECDCEQVGVTEVRLCWERAGEGPLGQDCRADARRSFGCAEKRGATGFELEPVATAFWIEPVCEGGAPAEPTGYQVPPPIVRDVVAGAVVTLSSLLIVVTDPAEDPRALCGATARWPAPLGDSSAATP